MCTLGEGNAYTLSAQVRGVDRHHHLQVEAARLAAAWVLAAGLDKMQSTLAGWV